MGLSTIQWTDYTFNPWIGCRKVAPECANCYAETLDRNRYSKTLAPGTKENPVSHWGSGPRHRTKTWGDPVKWNGQIFRHCRECGTRWGGGDGYCHNCGKNKCDWVRPRVFCASLADWLDDENVPIKWFADLLKLIHDTPHLDWLLLTKRPQNFAERMEDAFRFCTIEQPKPLAHAGLIDPHFLNWMSAWHVQEGCEEGEPDRAPENVWIGVSAGADQQHALDIPARVHFLSCEPMLTVLVATCAKQFDWIIFGGESGSKARPMDIEWIRRGVAMCRENGIAPFVKQLGRVPYRSISGSLNMPLMLVDKHGGDMDEWPDDDLRVREFPIP